VRPEFARRDAAALAAIAVRRIWRPALLLALAAYGLFLLQYTSDSVGGSDSSAYANTARRILRGSLVERPPALDLLGLPDEFTPVFLPLGFVLGPVPGTTAPLYPVGFPAHLAAAALALGPDRGPFLVSPIAALLCLLLMYLVGRELSLSRAGSAVAATLLAAWPPFPFQAVQPMSDIVATLWALAAILCALRSRRRVAWALASGAAFGIAILVRPTNALLAVPLLFALPLSPASLALFGMGGLPLAASLGLVNRHCYGSVSGSGYVKSGHLEVFALANFAPRIAYYGDWLLRTLTPLPFLTAIASAFQTRIPRSRRALLISWFGAYLIFYCFYWPYESILFLRFLLPGLPGLLFAAVLGAEGILERVRRPSAGFAGAAALALILWIDCRLIGKVGVTWIAEQERVYPLSCRWVDRNLPPKAIIVATNASGALAYYTDRIFARWDAISPERDRVLRSAARSKGYRFFALLYPKEVKELATHVPGAWRRIADVRGWGVWELREDGE
jgi:hypothetical protein